MSRRNAELLNGRVREVLQTRPFILSGPGIIIPSNASSRWANDAVKLPCLTADKLLEALRILRRNDNLALLSLFAGGSVSCAQGEGAAAFGPKHMVALCEILKDTELRVLDLGMVGDDFMFHNLKWNSLIHSLGKVTRLSMCPSVYRRLTRQEKATIQRRIDRAAKNPAEPVDEEMESLIENCIKDCNINPQFVPVRDDCLMRCSKCHKWRCTSRSVYERFQMKMFLCSHTHRSCDDVEDVKVDSWVQCMQCQKWRRVPRVLKIKFEASRAKFQCVDLARTNQSCDEPEEKRDEGHLPEEDGGKRKFEDTLITSARSSRGPVRPRYGAHQVNNFDLSQSRTPPPEPRLHRDPHYVHPIETREEEPLVLPSRSSRSNERTSSFDHQTPRTRSMQSDHPPAPHSSQRVPLVDRQSGDVLNAQENRPSSPTHQLKIRVDRRRRTDPPPSNYDNSDPDYEPPGPPRRRRCLAATPKARPKGKARAKRRVGRPKGVARGSSRAGAAPLAASVGAEEYALTFAPPRMSEAEYAAFTAADGGFAGESSVVSVNSASTIVPQQQPEQQQNTRNSVSKPEEDNIAHDTGAPQAPQIKRTPSRNDGTLVVGLQSTTIISPADAKARPMMMAYGPSSMAANSTTPRAHPYGNAQKNTAAPPSPQETNATAPSTPTHRNADAPSTPTQRNTAAPSTPAQKITKAQSSSQPDTPGLRQRYVAPLASTYATVPPPTKTPLSTSPATMIRVIVPSIWPVSAQVPRVVAPSSLPAQVPKTTLPPSSPACAHVPKDTSLQLSPAPVKLPNAATPPTSPHTARMPKVGTPPAPPADTTSQVRKPAGGRTSLRLANQATQVSASALLKEGQPLKAPLVPIPEGTASGELSTVQSSVALDSPKAKVLARAKRGTKRKVAATAATALAPPVPTMAEGSVASSAAPESEVPPPKLEGMVPPPTLESVAESWVQCDACNKWWRCTEAFRKKFENCFFDCEGVGSKCGSMGMKKKKKRR
eukprot:GEMP01000996.1.p1 GENE.GEMP01000996.1~~GEMP01000996.1.p1  ORF type:complete len:995 (+),score=194.58 GEMP01000996.1:121-3105(+)